MTDREFRRLSRAELIDIIYELQKNEARLHAELREMREKLEERNWKFSRCGSLAEAAAQVNGLFEAAQRTAESYLEQLRRAAQEGETENSDLGSEDASHVLSKQL